MTPLGERLVFVDVETVGCEPPPAIIQIAAVAVSSQLRVKETFEVKIGVEKEVGAMTPFGHRRFDAIVWQRCSVEPPQAAHAFGRFLRRHATVDAMSVLNRPYQVAQLAAHNANFDGPLLQDWFARLDVFLPASFRVLCTMQRAIWLFRENETLTPPRDYTLDTLCEYFGVPRPNGRIHDALSDVRATVELYRAMMAEAGRWKYAAASQKCP